jgi:hypothetical protein
MHPPAPHTTEAKLVVIVTAAELWPQLEIDLPRVGVKAYTWMDVSGRGGHGVRREGLLLTGNVRIEAVVTPDVCRALLEHLRTEYAGRELSAYESDVRALIR